MGHADDNPIWYAAYGSNCLEERFAAYLTGSRIAGAARAERGARDPRLPVATAPFWFPTGVRFLGDSRKWGGGGVAFLDHHGERPAPGRRYLITEGQFADVAAQESGRDQVEIPFGELVAGDVHVIGSRWYDGVLSFAPIDGISVVTFTSPQPLDDQPSSSPSAAYLGTIIRGLVEVHRLPARDLVAHLLAAPGVADGWTASKILQLLTK